MTWRIVEISSRCKLETKLNYLVIKGEETKKIHLSEIAILIIESTAVSLTATLLNEASKRDIKVIFCDEKRSPYAELSQYYGTFDSSECLRKQIGWKPDTIDGMWSRIVADKIGKQRDVLIRTGHPDSACLLDEYIKEITNGDSTNREGHAAKVYFFSLFGHDFARRDDNCLNSCLNYGYQILLSAFNREICSNGYNTELGIFHHNKFNKFNLASDLMEPFRPIVDETVIGMSPDDFGSDEKRILVNILNSTVVIDGKSNFLSNAIRIYCRSFFDAMENDRPEDLKTYEVEIHESDSVL